jgi:hypothetical protein
MWERFYCGLRLRVTFEPCPCSVCEFVPKYMILYPQVASMFSRKRIRNPPDKMSKRGTKLGGDKPRTNLNKEEGNLFEKKSKAGT